MRWYDLLRAIGEVAAEDTILASIYGETIRMAGTSQHKVPALDYRLITDTESEQWAPHIIQFDQWTETLEELRDSEVALERLFNLDVPAPALFSDVYAWAEKTDGADLTGPSFTDYFGRAIRFRFTPLRDVYTS